MRPLACSLLLLTSGSSLAAPAPSSDTEIGGEISAGYDSNPAQSHDGPELAFARIAIAAARQMRLGGSELTVGASGWFRDNESDNDSSRLTLRTDWSRETAQGAGLLTLAVAGAAYRDALVPADERNEAALTLRYDHSLTARDTLGLLGETRRLAYINPALPWSGRPGSAPSGRASNRSEHGRAPAALRRDDWLSSLGLDATHHWSPTLATVLTLAVARCDSTVSVEAYSRRGIELLMRVAPAPKWHLEFGLGWALNQYDQAPQQQEREDIQHAAELALRHTIGHSEWFCRLDWLDSNSTHAEQSFQQQVIGCGLARSF